MERVAMIECRCQLCRMRVPCEHCGNYHPPKPLMPAKSGCRKGLQIGPKMTENGPVLTQFALTLRDSLDDLDIV